MELEFVLSRQPNTGGVVEVDMVDVMSYSLAIEVQNMQAAHALLEAVGKGYAIRHVQLAQTEDYVILILHLKKVSS